MSNVMSDEFLHLTECQCATTRSLIGQLTKEFCASRQQEISRNKIIKMGPN